MNQTLTAEIMQSKNSGTPLEGHAECTEPSPWEGSVCESVPKTTCRRHMGSERIPKPKIDDIAGSNNTSHRCGVDRRASRHRHGTRLTADELRSNNDEDTGTQWRLAGVS